MPNINRPSGFRPVTSIVGGAFTGQVNRYFIPAADATAMFVGDLVVQGGTGDVNGVPSVARAAASATGVIGCIVGFEPAFGSDDNLPQYRRASQAAYALVADAPDQIFEVQANAITAVTAIGMNFNFTPGTGNLLTGNSVAQMDGGAGATTASLPLSLLGAVQSVDNDLAATASRWLVRINNHKYANVTTGV